MIDDWQDDLNLSVLKFYFQDIVFNGPSLSIPENSDNFVVGTFSATDEDRTDSHTFTLMNNIDNVFSISDGRLSVVKGKAQMESNY